ncbi:CAP-Gly domain-containing linker protein 1 [Dorcoceras hygrometricum]|uniref:CAP-Gly domain-containing linker protein 1 n=1 Tax=Dorcoceras hygrometricum TaxID=472368 RepID=A0A2Z7ATV6_9LAMI|nr:CAP-Gly domain-containing linker protein 1 [Dorcoceras hygrometricum]
MQEQFKSSSETKHREDWVKCRIVHEQINCSVQVWCSSAEPSFFSKRLDEIETTPTIGAEEESIRKGYSIGLRRVKMAHGSGKFSGSTRKRGLLLKSLKEKEGELEDREALNQTLIVQERKNNDELQEVRKELVNGLEDISSIARIGIKRMGELDSKSFHEAVKKMRS